MRRKVNVPIMLTSLVLSMMLWFAVYGQSLTVGKDRILYLTPSSVESYDSTQWHIDQIQPVKLSLSGQAKDVEAAYADPRLDREVSINLRGIKPGENLYPLDISMPLSSYVTNSPRVGVIVERKGQKDVPIDVVLQGQLQDQRFTLDQYPTSVKTVTVTAPVSRLKSITAARAFLDLSQVDTTNPEPQKANLTVVGKDGRAFSSDVTTDDVTANPESVMITPILTAAPVEQPVLVVASIEGYPPAGFAPGSVKVTPSEIMLSGSPYTLRMTTQVKTVKIDVSKLTASHEFKAALMLPVGTESKTKFVKVRYEIKPDPSFDRTSKGPDPNSPTGGTPPATTTSTTGGNP